MHPGSLFERIAQLEGMVTAQAGMIAELQWRLTARKEAKSTLSRIAYEAARRHRLTVAEIRGDSRVRALTLARKDICADALDAGFTLEQIGEYLNRDHTTISHLAGRLSRRKAKAPE